MTSPSAPPRRKFLNGLMTAGIGGFALSLLYPVIRYLNPPPEAADDVSSVFAGKASELPVNQGKIFKFGSKPALLVHTPDGQFKAFIAECTHLDCTVQYRPDMKLIWCACHNGKYNLNGENISGPPPRPLTPLTVNIKEDQIFVSQNA